MYNGSVPLVVLLGVTTHSGVVNPSMNVYVGSDGTRKAESLSVSLATKLHLPYSHHRPMDWRWLKTALSYSLTRSGEAFEDGPYRFEFCYEMEETDSTPYKSFVQFDVLDARGSMGARQGMHLGPVFLKNGMHVEHHKGFSFVEGVTSSTLESDMRVQWDGVVAPTVVAGSMHSIYLTFRGTDSIALDEGESQAQFFFSPDSGHIPVLQYVWRPGLLFKNVWNDTYIAYVLSDAEERAEVRLRNWEEQQDAKWLSYEYLRYRIAEWPVTWLTSFSLFSSISYYGGALMSACLAVVGLHGLLMRLYYLNRSAFKFSPSFLMRNVYSKFSLLYLLIILTVGTEIVTGLWSTYALKVCTSNPPHYMTDEELTRRMDWKERITLAVLLLRPTYFSCRVPWIKHRILTPWSALPEHLATVLFGQVVSMLGLLFLAGLLFGSFVAFFPIGRFVLKPILLRFRRVGVALVMVVWAGPMIASLCAPIPHLAIVNLSMLVLTQVFATTAPLITHGGKGGFVTQLCVACSLGFSAHFNGAVLFFRNLVVTPSNEPILDRERFSFFVGDRYFLILMWLSFGVIHLFNYLSLLDHETNRRLSIAKKRDGEAAGSTEGYTFGSLRRRHPHLFRWIDRIHSSCYFLALWSIAVDLRRPLEVSVCHLTVVFISVGLCVMFLISVL
ncbi:hypothetical protein, conserved [Angomonas deanei]|uniref:Uncharacterized protein n=1 Tax=Angomonas deanei TaxID=59799 RepID=A0A7G2C7E4_9TRYP|nr:hypothetical protein, conserved [Angomonas deanei]